MSQLSFLLNADEEGELIREGFEAGAVFVPDLHYEVPSLPRLTSFEEYCKYREKTFLFFILHDSYDVCPIELRSGEKQGVPFFYVMQRNGGPAIHFLSTSRFLKNEKVNLNPGFLSHYPTFLECYARSE